MRPVIFLLLLWLLPLNIAARPATSTAPSVFWAGNRLAAYSGARGYVVHRQGNDSNCDYIAVSNGVQNTGGDGALAYQRSRDLVPQGVFDYHEGFYTLYGPRGSDRPFSINNLGAAPDAFVGVYEALGYDAVMLGRSAGAADRALAQTIYERLAQAPDTSFAHLWITPQRPSVARRLTVAATDEVVDLLYPYHEVVAMVAPDRPGEVVILDGLVGYPFTISLETLAHQLRGFNKVLLVSASGGSLRDHQQRQARQVGQPYVLAPLGGQYLAAARRWWGGAYQQWGQVIGPPFRVSSDLEPRVVLPGRFVHYERTGAQQPELALLGVRMGHDLEAAGVLPAGTIQPWAARGLPAGLHGWVSAQFGSEAAFAAVFGSVLTDEFWLTPAQLHEIVLRGVDVPQADQPGYVVVLTERAMLAWDPVHGSFMIPLGQIYYEHDQRQAQPSE